MAELIDVIDIDLSQVQEEAEETQKTLKDLRQEVKDLRTQLENTAIGSEEFGDTLSELTRKQQELTNVTKSGIAAQKGSYNDLVNQMAILKAQWRSTADEAERAALGEQINDINNQLKQLDGTIGNHQRNVGNYKGELKALKEQMMTLEEGTEEYAAACARAAEISQKMQDVNEFVAQSAQDLGDQLGNVVGVAGGMVGAFQTVQATLNLVGVESESVGKALQTMQNLMAITQGLTAIEGAIDKYKRLNETIKGLTIVQKLFGTQSKANAVASAADAAASTADATAKGAQAAATTTATTAQWSLNAAMAANPLGAILIAITAVITALISLGSWLTSVGDSSEEAARQNDLLTQSLERQNAEIDYNIRLMRARGMSELEALTNSTAAFEKKMKDAYDNYVRIKRQAEAEGNLWSWIGIADNISDDEDAEIEKARQTYLKEKREFEKHLEDIEIESEKEATARRNASVSAAKAAAKERQQALKQEAEEKKRIISEAWRQVEDLERSIENRRKRRDLENKKKLGLSMEDYEIEKRKLELEAEAADAYAEYEKYIQNLDTLLKQRQITLEEYNTKYAKANLDQMNISLSYANELSKEEDDIKREYMKKRIDTLRSTLDEERKLYEDQRERIMRSVILQEKAMETSMGNIPEGATSKYKLEQEKIYLELLQNAYAEKINLLNEQDNLERQKIMQSISLAAMRKSEIEKILSDEANLMENEKQLLQEELGMINTTLQELSDQHSLVGSETLLLAEKFDEVSYRLSTIDMSVTVAQLESVKEGLESLKNSFTELNNIGGAFSNEWATAFDSIISGVDVAISSLTDMNSVLKSNASETEKAAAKWKGYGNMASAALGAASSILSALADEQDEASREGFETQKKLQIAAATMSMLQGIASAWASAMQLGPIAGPIMGGVLTAMTATLGGIQIAKIQQQQFGGSGNSGAGGSSNSVPDITPAFTAVQAMGQGVNSVTTIEGASADGNIKDTKVYVSETDISSTQHRVNVMESEAMY